MKNRLDNMKIILILLNQFGHNLCHISDVDTVWTRGGKRPPPPGSKYLSQICSQSHIKLTNNDSNKDFKSDFKIGLKIGL